VTRTHNEEANAVPHVAFTASLFESNVPKHLLSDGWPSAPRGTTWSDDFLRDLSWVICVTPQLASVEVAVNVLLRAGCGWCSLVVGDDTVEYLEMHVRVRKLAGGRR
jgi:hypothetical protein